MGVAPAGSSDTEQRGPTARSLLAPHSSWTRERARRGLTTARPLGPSSGVQRARADTQAVTRDLPHVRLPRPHSNSVRQRLLESRFLDEEREFGEVQRGAWGHRPTSSETRVRRPTCPAPGGTSRGRGTSWGHFGQGGSLLHRSGGMMDRTPPGVPGEAE